MGEDRESDPNGSPDGDTELDRAAILRRRAVFVASAVAGLGLAASCGETAPAACLDVAPPPHPETTTDVGSGGEAPHGSPQPCLEVAPAPCLEMPMPADAGVQDTDAGPPPQPQPCLRTAPPKPCLKMAPPG